MRIKDLAKFLKLKQLSSKFNFNATLTLNNKKFTIPIIQNMGLLNLSVKEDWFSDLLKSLKIPETSVFIDIGVNVGQTLLTFRSHYNNPYWGFEPNPNCVFYLQNLIRSNRLKQTSILPIGLSSVNQLAKFYTKNSSDSAGTLVHELRPGYYDAGEINYVPLFAFDELHLENAAPISLIKIDVEGAELEVLLGLVQTIKKHKPKLICEILDGHSEKSIPAMQERADKLVALMKSLNYDIYRIQHLKTQLTFEKMNGVELKIWTPESFNLNDYLFVPEGQNPL